MLEEAWKIPNLAAGTFSTEGAPLSSTYASASTLSSASTSPLAKLLAIIEEFYRHFDVFIRAISDGQAKAAVEKLAKEIESGEIFSVLPKIFDTRLSDLLIKAGRTTLADGSLIDSKLLSEVLGTIAGAIKKADGGIDNVFKQLTDDDLLELVGSLANMYKKADGKERMLFAHTSELLERFAKDYGVEVITGTTNKKLVQRMDVVSKQITDYPAGGKYALAIVAGTINVNDATKHFGNNGSWINYISEMFTTDALGNKVEDFKDAIFVTKDGKVSNHKLHGHHINFKKGLGAGGQAAAQNTNEKLWDLGIHPFFGKENLVFAPNAGHADEFVIAIWNEVNQLGSNITRITISKILQKNANRYIDTFTKFPKGQ